MTRAVVRFVDFDFDFEAAFDFPENPGGWRGRAFVIRSAPSAAIRSCFSFIDRLRQWVGGKAAKASAAPEVAHTFFDHILWAGRQGSRVRFLLLVSPTRALIPLFDRERNWMESESSNPSGS